MHSYFEDVFEIVVVAVDHWHLLVMQEFCFHLALILKQFYIAIYQTHDVFKPCVNFLGVHLWMMH